MPVIQKNSWCCVCNFYNISIHILSHEQACETELDLFVDSNTLEHVCEPHKMQIISQNFVLNTKMNTIKTEPPNGDMSKINEKINKK